MKSIKNIKISLITALLASTLFAGVLSASVYAAPQATGGCTPKKLNPITFFPAWYDGLTCEDSQGGVSIMSPGDAGLAGNDASTGKRFGTWATIIAMNVVRLILYVVGYASIGFIIFGGFKYMLNGDNSGGTVAARKTIQNAVIGLVLSIMSVSIVTFIVSRVSP